MSRDPNEPTEKTSTPQAAISILVLDLNQSFEAELNRLRTRFADRLEALRRETTAVADELTNSASRLGEAFAGAATASSSPETLTKDLCDKLQAEIALIFRKLRPSIDRELKLLSPRRKPIQATLAAIAEAYGEVIGRLPEQAAWDFGAAEEPVAEETEDKTDPPPSRATLEGVTARAALQLREGIGRQLQITPRSVVEEILAARPGIERDPLVIDYAEGYRQLAKDLADIWRGLRFHLEVAADDLAALQKPPVADAETVDASQQLEEMAQLVEAALRNAAQKLPAILPPIEAMAAKIEASLRLRHRQLTETIAQELSGIGSWQNIRRHLLRLGGRKVTATRQKAEKLIDASRQEVSRSANQGIAQTGSLFRNLQSLLGKSGQTEETLLALTDLETAEQLREKTLQFPPLYQRLFTLGPLRSREFLVGREEEMEDLEEIYHRWKSGKACSVAIVGPEGSGKTSLVNCFESQFGGKEEWLKTEVRERLKSEGDALRFFQRWFGREEEFASPQEVVELILSEPRRVLVLEGGHNLALRVIDGYRAAKVFFYILLATRRHTLWLITFRKYPWARLDYQIGVGQYFTHQVRTLFHSQKEIQEAIMLRHRTASTPLHFRGTAEGSREEAQKQLENKFFRDLFASSFGSTEAAILLWLHSLSYDEKEKTLQVSPLGKIDYSFLRAIGRDYLFALAEVISHGGLTPEEYGQIFRTPPLESRMLFDYLTHLNLLKATTEKGSGKPPVYRMNPLFFGAVAESLETMNILY